MEDPLMAARYRLPATAQAQAPGTPPVRPFAARYAVPVVEIGKHGKKPTRPTVCLPTEKTGDGEAGNPGKPDDTLVTGHD
jgi:hypothetical protein